MQHCALNAFKKVLTSSAPLLEVFRKEGIWDLIFSENFFYFGSSSEECYEVSTPYPDGSPKKVEEYSASGSTGIQILQIEASSFVELAATSNGSIHNLDNVDIRLRLTWVIKGQSGQVRSSVDAKMLNHNARYSPNYDSAGKLP
ncbi:hypothetical protein Gohar_008640 [Gossypium harknessii]|uniref:Uncharacterized protein n=1 Tax=Gossypium harknessii TaxID=34285 RepID=A0A7J9GKH2_9ROSI|nr:hypothetical protein [Gossypium harknessii]